MLNYAHFPDRSVYTIDYIEGRKPMPTFHLFSYF